MRQFQINLYSIELMPPTPFYTFERDFELYIEVLRYPRNNDMIAFRQMIDLKSFCVNTSRNILGLRSFSSPSTAILLISIIGQHPKKTDF